MMSIIADKDLKKTPTCDMWRLDRTWRKENYTRTREGKILMTDAFDKINPTDPLRLGKQVAWRKRNDPIPEVIRWWQQILHGEPVSIVGLVS